MKSYTEFVASKVRRQRPAGFDVSRYLTPPALKGFQREIVEWACRRGRAAIFADTGLGKTLMELAWADAVVQHTGGPVLLLTPLAVGPQTVREAGKFKVAGVSFVTCDAEITGPGIYVTNYAKLHKFDAGQFAGIVLDESSILKSLAGATKQDLCDRFAQTPYRLACTATPAPNDHTELGNHAEFLGICTRAEMLAEYFVHDSADTAEWRLKGHAAGEFWGWVGSWAKVIRKPSDLGYPNEGYDLPPLRIHEHVIEGEASGGVLFAVSETTLVGQRHARRQTLNARVAKAAELVNAGEGPCIVWCELNDEADAVTDAIAGAVQVAGSDDDDVKAARLNGFSGGEFNVLVTKGKIAGFGMNWQHCRRMVFVGLTHSYEAFYQMVRRCWRYGQTMPVDAHVITSDREYAVLENVRKKQAAHDEMADAMVRGVKAAEARNITPPGDSAEGDGWTVHHGDCVQVVSGIQADSIDYCIFSPPFASLYTYSDSPLDMGNSRNGEEFIQHFRYLVAELYRVMCPGRVLTFHVANIPAMKERDGFIGLKDFRGELIREFISAGFIFHSEIVVWKDPVVEMQRTKALGLLHKQLKKDSAMSRQGIPDTLVTMRKPGKNPRPVTHTNDTFPVDVWQRFASPVWFDIDQTRTLNYQAGRAEDDERHICPLQLDVVERCLELWSNPGDLVLSPFTGIGTEGYCSVKAGRRFIGSELKDSYYRVACRNLAAAEKLGKQKCLFSEVAEVGAA